MRRFVTPFVIAAPVGVGILLLAASVRAQGAPPLPPPLPPATAPAPAPAPKPGPAPVAAPAPAPAPAGGGAVVGGTPVGGAVTAAPAEEAEVEAPISDEEKRDRMTHESPTPWGPTGLLHTPSAMTGPAGTFRVGMGLDWFKSSGFLCTSDYPCVVNGKSQTSDEHSHIGAALVVNATLIEGLEGYVATRVYANSNDQSRPNLLQVLGDTTLGLKYVRGLGNGMVNIGGGADLLMLNGTGGIGLNGSGTSFRLRALSTFALDHTEKKTPVRFHLGLAYLFDNSGQVVADVEQQRTDRLKSRQQITRLERYGLGINKVDRFEIAVGVEGLLANDKVRPFLEYTVGLPVNRQGYECPKAQNIAGGGRTDECLGDPDNPPGFSATPSKLTIGARAFPFKGGMQGLSFLAGVDIGITGTSKFMSEVAPQAPYTLWLGFALSTDTVEKPPKIVEKIKEVKVDVPVGPTLVKVRGVVHEQGTNNPIPNALVTYVGASLAPLSTGPDGVFGDDVLPGTYQLSVKADGFKDGTCGGTAIAPKKPGAPPPPVMPGKPGAAVPPPAPMGGTLEIDCPLEALPKVGSATLSVVDQDSNTGVSGITVSIADATGANEKTISSDGNGVVKVEGLQPGTWYAKISAEGYFATKQSFEIRVREDTKANLGIRLRPKDKLVTVDKKELKVKQQVHFAVDKAIILGDSVALLEEVADVLISTPRIKRIEIQGHTDNTGTKEHNQELSQARADSVKAFLVKNGVDASKLEAKGYGQDKPIAPNVSEAGKGKNRRVQFMILEQDEPPKPAK
jgi:outer membrane protein OmpA-like peptidoglycan-associated protein